MNNQNPNKVIDQIARDIPVLLSQGVTRAHVCLWEGQIKLRYHKHITAKHDILRVFTQYQLTNGIQPSEWETLAAKIARLQKGTNQCPDPQKPSQSKKPTPSLMP